MGCDGLRRIREVQERTRNTERADRELEQIPQGLRRYITGARCWIDLWYTGVFWKIADWAVILTRC